MERAPPMIPSPGTKLPRPDTMPPAGAWAKMTLGRSRIVMEIQGSIPIPDCKIPFSEEERGLQKNIPTMWEQKGSGKLSLNLLAGM